MNEAEWQYWWVRFNGHIGPNFKNKFSVADKAFMYYVVENLEKVDKRKYIEKGRQSMKNDVMRELRAPRVNIIKAKERINSIRVEEESY